MANSWAPEVFVEGRWSRNALRFATEAEAKASASALFGRWWLTEGYRATEDDEQPNYRLENGGMIELRREAE